MEYDVRFLAACAGLLAGCVLGLGMHMLTMARRLDAIDQLFQKHIKTINDLHARVSELEDAAMSPNPKGEPAGLCCVAGQVYYRQPDGTLLRDDPEP